MRPITTKEIILMILNVLQFKSYDLVNWNPHLTGT